VTALRVAVVAYPLVDELDLFGSHAVLAKAAAAHPGLSVEMAAREPWITGSAGVSIAVPRSLETVAAADAVVVPGGRGARQAADDADLLDALRAAAAHGATLYGVCTGSLVIAATGLAAGKRLAVHGDKHRLLTPYAVGEVSAGLVRDGAIVTVGGDMSASVKAVDLAFQLLYDLAPQLVGAVRARMELLPGRTAMAEAR
jgi:putative intracellular protease/amidase